MKSLDKASYSAKENYKLVDGFNTAYWSGLDAQVYMGNIWVQYCVQCNYQVMETVRPYWHYSQYVPSRLRHGTRIIQGEITINYTRDSYLYNVLHRLGGTGTLRTDDLRSTTQSQADGTQTGSPVLYNVYPWGPQSGRKIMTEEMSADQRREFVLARKKFVDQQKLGLATGRPSINQTSGMFEIGPQGFDLNIVFGAYLSRPLTLQYAANEDQYFLDGATFQDLRPNPGPLGTGIKLVGVDIQGMSKSIVDDGRPLMETFTFLARDVRILVPEDIAEFPDYASIYSQTSDGHLGTTATLQEVQDFMKGMS